MPVVESHDVGPPDLRLKADADNFGDGCSTGTFCESYTVLHRVSFLHGPFQIEIKFAANSITAATGEDVNCGHAGGCELAISMDGLSTHVAAGLGEVTVCGRVCPPIPCLGSYCPPTNTVYRCTIEALQTTRSLQDFVLYPEQVWGEEGPSGPSLFVGEIDPEPDLSFTSFQDTCATMRTADIVFGAFSTLPD